MSVAWALDNTEDNKPLTAHVMYNLIGIMVYGAYGQQDVSERD